MYHIVQSVSELRDPFICFCIISRFMQEAGEDFVDYNENLVNGWTFSMWLYGKGYISEEQIEELAKIGIPDIQEVLKGEILFPISYGEGDLSNIKGYIMLSEYISGLSEFRQHLWDVATDKSPAFVGNHFYKDENGISLALKIDEEDMKETKIYTVDELQNKTAFELSLWEQFASVKLLSIEECENIYTKRNGE